ncbi:MAG: hypothetical protein D6822_00775 [Cyanobacteria bacterium J149]|nr:MAG: hypothetical protein D6822_00775 [Cyanobacteria bacterium J149]
MLILEAEQIEYCLLLVQFKQGKKKLPGVNYKGNLFVKVASFEQHEMEPAIKKCREFLDRDEAIPSIVVKEATGFSVFCEQPNTNYVGKMEPSPEVSSSAKPAKSKINLEKIVAQMRGENGVPIKGRMQGLKLYKRSFVGSEAVDWLTNTLNISRPQAIKIGQLLLSNNLIRHVTGEHQFEDRELLYRFTEDEGKSIWTDKIF